MHFIRDQGRIARDLDTLIRILVMERELVQPGSVAIGVRWLVTFCRLLQLE